MPSMTGISMSSTTTPISVLVTSSIAALPLLAVATTLIAGTLSRDRVRRPRMTWESSTTKTRIGVDAVAALFCNPNSLTPVSRQYAFFSPSRLRSDQTDLGELGLDNLAVERLHDVFVGAGADRLLDVGDVVLGGAEHHHRRLPAIRLAQLAQEIDAAHHRHVPVQQDRIGHALQARVHGLATVFRLFDLEIETFEDLPGDHSNNLPIIHHQTALHRVAPPR